MFSALALASCGTKPAPSKTIEESSQQPVSVATGHFEMVTNLQNVMTIHTDRQATYLEYNGDYSKIPADQYPNGDQFLSDPNNVTLEWTHDPDADQVIKNYSVTFGMEEDLSDGYEVMGTTEPTIELMNVWLGSNYFQIKAYYEDGTDAVSDILEFYVDETCPRNIKVEGLTNCRDLGGRELEDGGTIKQGLLYRTSGNNFQNKAGVQNVVGKGIITEDAKKEMTDHLKVKTEINVNSNTQYNLNLPNTTIKNCYMDYGGNALHHFSRNAESVKDYFDVIGNSDNFPAFFHCRIGTDRTGLCGILTNGLLGMKLNDIYQDYLFSNFGNIEDKRYVGEIAGQDNVEIYINQIQELKGDALHNKFYNMLLALGIPSETLDNVINTLTDGPTATGNDAGQVVANVDQLSISGTTLKTDSSDRDHPDNYVTLSSDSTKVSMKVNADKAFTGQIVAYLGNSENSSTKKISDSIQVDIDGVKVDVTNKTYADAGMGTCGNNRMNYYPVILGEGEFSAGEHTLTISGKSGNMNLGTLSVFQD